MPKRILKTNLTVWHYLAYLPSKGVLKVRLRMEYRAGLGQVLHQTVDVEGHVGITASLRQHDAEIPQLVLVDDVGSLEEGVDSGLGLGEGDDLADAVDVQ